MDNTILVKNIYYMLSYAFKTLNQINYEYIEKEYFENIHNLFAEILSKGIGTQLKHGLHKEYSCQKDSLVSLRGKINMQGTIQNLFARRQTISCEFDELTENNFLNQILKSTVLLLISHAEVNHVRKNELKKKMLYFSNVDVINVTSVEWKSIRFERNNQTYRMLISICQMIIDGMLLTTEKGDYKMASFLGEKQMSRLYEKFILEYYKKELPLITARAAQIPWALDDGIGTFLPMMQSDIILCNKEKVLIIDAKYYTQAMLARYDKEKLRSAHLYQIFTYVKNAEFDEKNTNKKVSGMLLYAKTNEEVQPGSEYQMSGNKIEVRTLDLNVDFKKITEQLKAIVNNYF